MKIFPINFIVWELIGRMYYFLPYSTVKMKEDLVALFPSFYKQKGDVVKLWFRLAENLYFFKPTLGSN